MYFYCIFYVYRLICVYLQNEVCLFGTSNNEELECVGLGVRRGTRIIETSANAVTKKHPLVICKYLSFFHESLQPKSFLIIYHNPIALFGNFIFPFY